MRQISLWAWRGIWLMPAIMLLGAAAPRFVTGLAVDAAFPVPNYMEMNIALPRSAYGEAAAALALANRDDGDSHIEQAEAASFAGSPRQEILEVLQAGLSRSPASASGWTLMAEQLSAEDPERAAAALVLALDLGPFEFYIAGRRARAAAILWDALPENGKQQALRQTQLLWSEPQLRPELLPLLSMPNGPELVGLALRDQPGQLRALNRWAAAQDRSDRR